MRKIKKKIAIILGVILIFLIYKFQDELGYIYDPYMHQDCINDSETKHFDTFINERITSNNKSYVTIDGFNGIPYDCPPIYGKSLIMNWEDYNNSDNEKTVIDGGSFKHKDGCISSRKIALIVPYRNRPYQLNLFVNNIHKFLIKQNIQYTLFIIHQDDFNIFNRGALFNAAYKEINLIDNFDCLVFHDIDTFPMHLLNRYDCPSSPRHLRVLESDNKFYAPYKSYTGGVTTVSSYQFLSVNGFSNFYWGWGLEDDDLFKRLESKSFYMKRPSLCLSAFHSINKNHNAQYTWSLSRFFIYWMRDLRRNFDGINSVQYNITKIEKRPLYTSIHVNLNNKLMNQAYFAIITAPLILLYLLFIFLSKSFACKFVIRTLL